jgi:hypothetical protein
VRGVLPARCNQLLNERKSQKLPGDLIHVHMNSNSTQISEIARVAASKGRVILKFHRKPNLTFLWLLTSIFGTRPAVFSILPVSAAHLNTSALQMCHR